MSPRTGSGWRRRLSTLLAVTVAMTGVSLGGQLANQSASATHPVVTGKAVCNTQTGKYDVTWSIGGDTGYPNETATIKTQSRATTPTLVGKTVKGPGTVTGVETGLSAGSYSQTVQVQWTNHRAGDLVSQTGTVATGSGYCKQADVKDASASVSITPATCDSPEKLVLGATTNATWGSPTRTTGPGDYSVVATGNAGPPQHLFADGSKTKTFTGTLKGKDTSRNCWAKDAVASVTVTPPSCTTAGSTSVTGLTNAVLVGTLDQSVGTHTATFKSNDGHLFPNGSDTIQVSYTVLGSGSTTGDANCAPPNRVTYSEWKDGTWVCGDTTVTQTRTMTTTRYVWNSETRNWVEVESAVVTEQQTRNLTQQEIGDCPLVPGDIVATCTGNVPYLSYAVDLPKGFTPSSAQPLTITFVNPSGANYVVSNLPISGKLLWPGAKASKPQQWPGWTYNAADGSYTETPNANYGWTRKGVTVKFDVNPSYQTVVKYPSASELCANPPAKKAPKQVKGSVKKLDKCGLNNFFFAKKVTGAHYVVRGKVVREGVWLKTKTKTLKVKVVADSAKYKVVGKKLFVVKFPNNRSCGTPPHKPPRTGLSVS